MNPLFAKLAAEEQKFFSSEFLSPVIREQPVRVRIAGVVLNLKVEPKDYEGWGIFNPKDQKTAVFVREPTLAEKRQYFELFPRFSFIISHQGERLLGILANHTDARVKIEGQVPILLPHEVRLFDCVDVRFDGANFWYEAHSSFRSRKFSNALRDLLSEETEPDKVEMAGMSAEERLAYRIAFDMEIESKKDRKEERLRKSLERGGAVFRSYMERGNTYTVEFTVNGERHTSTIDGDTLQVRSAGICLSGGDRAFDLQSLVSVIREGQNRHLIHHVGLRR